MRLSSRAGNDSRTDPSRTGRPEVEKRREAIARGIAAPPYYAPHYSQPEGDVKCVADSRGNRLHIAHLSGHHVPRRLTCLIDLRPTATANECNLDGFASWANSSSRPAQRVALAGCDWDAPEARRRWPGPLPLYRPSRPSHGPLRPLLAGTGKSARKRMMGKPWCARVHRRPQASADTVQ